jgi:hypothetical protein
MVMRDALTEAERNPNMAPQWFMWVDNDALFTNFLSTPNFQDYDATGKHFVFLCHEQQIYGEANPVGGWPLQKGGHGRLGRASSSPLRRRAPCAPRGGVYSLRGGGRQRWPVRMRAPPP